VGGAHYVFLFVVRRVADLGLYTYSLRGALCNRPRVTREGRRHTSLPQTAVVRKQTSPLYCSVNPSATAAVSAVGPSFERWGA